MIDLAALYHDHLDRVERSNRPLRCPACDGTGRTRADRGYVRCRWCGNNDAGDRAREAAVRAALWGGGSNE